MYLLQKIVSGFNTVPFIFAGSGITRRYYNLPDWKGLLSYFASQTNNSIAPYSFYHNMALKYENKNGIMPTIATLIQKDFDRQWFSNKTNNDIDKNVLQYIDNGCSPFKFEIAKFIKQHSIPVSSYKDEIQKLKHISKKNIAGIITTNYDTFFEDLFEGYNTYIGQDELIFSAIQETAEIYKIHGSITNPKSIIINDSDYTEFCQKSRYISAKLMTIFMEYPIIFIGYSITDENIKRIFNDISFCVPQSKLDNLRERFVFIEYNENQKNYEISQIERVIGNSYIPMTKISLSNFGMLYDALSTKKIGCPIKILRRFKEEIYTYIISSKPGPMLKVKDIENDDIDESQIAISIGRTTTAEYGLQCIAEENDWYSSIVTGYIEEEYNYSYDQLLIYVYKNIKKHNKKSYIPAYRYLSKALQQHQDILAELPNDFNSLFSNTNKKNRKLICTKYNSLFDLFEQENKNKKRLYSYMCSLKEEQYDVDLMEKILLNVFHNNKYALNHVYGNEKSDLKRLIRIYDYLKWGKDLINKTKRLDQNRLL